MRSNERSVRNESSRKFFFTCDVVYMPEGLNDVSNLHIFLNYHRCFLAISLKYQKFFNAT